MRLALAVLVVSACRSVDDGPVRGNRTNVVLILTDDQGYGDFGSADNPVLDTPNLDRLAARSARVGRFYVNPVCSATRASLLTGRWAYRTRVVDTFRGRSMMDPEEVTLAEVLRDAGYRTGIFGKWHLGDGYPLRPQDQGFEKCLVLRGGGLAQPSEPLESGNRYTDPILLHDGVEERTAGYCTDVYFDAALAFIDDAVERERPFFAYVATNAPHEPLHDVPEELLAKYRARDLSGMARPADAELERIARVYAMVENIDRNVGRLLDHLDARGLTEDTLVVFLSDNGPTPGRWAGGLSGTKGTVHEGGIRTRFFLARGDGYRGRTLGGSNAAHVDVFPTVLRALGLEAPAGLALDGVDLFSAAPDPARPVVLQSHRGDVPEAGHNAALVLGNLKLVRASGFGREAAAPDAPWRLFDLERDPAESRDLAAERPEELAALLAGYERWFADVSTTRPDNWAPPRIVLDPDAEPRCVLTRQDWRPSDGGWGSDGRWLLRAPCDQERSVTLLFREPRTIHGASLELGAGREIPFQVDAPPSSRIELGAVDLPRGELDLRVRVRGPAGEEAPWQVVLGLP